jgi:hypothetical protein
MEVSVEIHILVVLPSGKGSPASIEHEPMWTLEPVLMLGRRDCIRK